MNPSRRICFTLNNYTCTQVEALNKALDDDTRVRYACYGKEVGESGTPHLQGYISLRKVSRLPALIKNFGQMHYSACKGSEQQNITYCSKDDDFTEFGKRASPGKRNDLDVVKALLDDGGTLRDVADTDFNVYCRYKNSLSTYIHLIQEPRLAESVRGIWIWGPPGTGKSHTARDLAQDDLYLKPQNKWFDGYCGQSNILIDDFDRGGSCLGHYLKIWADKWPCNGEVKGATVSLNHTNFMITSNYNPRSIFEEDEVMLAAIERRFVVIHKPIRETKITWDKINERRLMN